MRIHKTKTIEHTCFTAHQTSLYYRRK